MLRESYKKYITTSLQIGQIPNYTNLNFLVINTIQHRVKIHNSNIKCSFFPSSNKASQSDSITYLLTIIKLFILVRASTSQCVMISKRNCLIKIIWLLNNKFYLIKENHNRVISLKIINRGVAITRAITQTKRQDYQQIDRPMQPCAKPPTPPSSAIARVCHRLHILISHQRQSNRIIMIVAKC